MVLNAFGIVFNIRPWDLHSWTSVMMHLKVWVCFHESSHLQTNVGCSERCGLMALMSSGIRSCMSHKWLQCAKFKMSKSGWDLRAIVGSFARIIRYHMALKVLEYSKWRFCIKHCSFWSSKSSISIPQNVSLHVPLKKAKLYGFGTTFRWVNDDRAIMCYK